ncbi:MAG: hypothetical protein HOO96_15145 [Polyangiaceae bacterium]|nr:hypothetical protein [Polyangiaceae bacterium]
MSPDTMRVEGEFVTHVRAEARSRPGALALAGPGACEVCDEGLRLQGFRAASTGWAVLVFVVATLDVTAALFFTSTRDASFYVGLGAVVIALSLSNVFFGAVARHRADQPVRTLVPWSAVTRVGRAGDALIIHVGAEPRTGTVLEFVPQSDAGVLLRLAQVWAAAARAEAPVRRSWPVAAPLVAAS